MVARKSPESWVKETYQNVLGDFSVKTLINLIVVVLATLAVPFFGAGFSWETFYSKETGVQWGFLMMSAFKIIMNLTTKLTLANHTYDRLLKIDPDIKDTHETIMKCKNIITKNESYEELKLAIDTFNKLNTLNMVDDILDDKMSKSKDDSLTDQLFDAQTNVRKYMGYVSAGTEDTDEGIALRKQIVKHLAGVKAESYSTASIFSKSDTVKRAKKVEHNRKKQIDKKVGNSIVGSVVTLVLLNAIEFIQKGFNGNSLIQALINTVLLTYSGTTGVQIGHEAVEDYKQVMQDKADFLVSFISGLGMSNQLTKEVA